VAVGSIYCVGVGDGGMEGLAVGRSVTGVWADMAVKVGSGARVGTDILARWVNTTDANEANMM
jgi:hypothetical protein